MSYERWDIGLGIVLKDNAISDVQTQIDSIGKDHPIKLTINSTEIKKQIDDIKKQLQSLNNIKINLSDITNSANIKTPKVINGSDTRYIYTVTEAYKDLMNIINQVRSNETALAKLDIKTNPEQIKVLKEQIKSLNVEAEKLWETWSGKFTLVQTNNIDRVWDNEFRNLNKITAQRADKTAVEENINAYKTLLSLQNQISSKKISVAKLDSNKNANEISEITSQINSLETTYSNLKQKLSGKLNIGQLQELDNISKQTATDINTITAKLLDIEIAQSNTAGITEIKTQFQSLITIAKEMGSLQIKIKGLENSGGSSNQIKELNSQLMNLTNTYNVMYNDFVSKGGAEIVGASNFGKLTSVISNTDNQLKVLQATYQDTRNRLSESIKVDIDNKTLANKIKQLQTQFSSLGIENNNILNNFNELNLLLSRMGNSDNIESVISDYKKFDLILKSTKNDIEILKNQSKNINVSLKLEADKRSLSQDIDLWFKRNSAAAIELKERMKEIQSQIRSADGEKLNALRSQMSAVAKEARIAGDNALTFGDRLKAQVSKLGVYFSGIMIITKAIQATKQAIQTVIELDTALIDLKKTTTATDEELQKFYFEANETGKRLGVTTQDVIQATAEWSRLGYSIKEAQTMAETSSIFASISPNVDIEKATDGLVSAMKAYKIEANDALDGVASKINAIGNSQAVSNEDIVEFLTRSSSAMAVANNTLDETIALGTAITEVTRDAANAGQVMKTASMRIRGYDEDTEQLSKDVQVLVGDIANLTKTAEHPIGVSIFSDEAKTQYKSTVEILREISKVWDELTDKQQAQVLEALGGKRGGQALAAAIENFDAVEKSLNTMQNSAGNAMKEMGVIEESLDYKLNKLKQTGVGIAQNIFSQKTVGGWVTGLTKTLEVVDKLTGSIGGLGTAFTALMTYKGLKGVGIFDYFKTNGTSMAQGFKDFFTKPILSQKATDLGIDTIGLKSLQEYNNLMKSGVGATTAFRQTMVGATPATRQFAKEMARGNVSIKELAVSSKEAQLGMNLLTSAMNMGFSLVVSAGINLALKGIYELTHAYEKAAEKADQSIASAQQAKDSNEQIQKLIDKYKELKEAQTKENDTETKKELLGLQQEITNLIASQPDLYSQQAKNIDLINGGLEEQLGLLQEISDEQYKSVTNSAEKAYRDAHSATSKYKYDSPGINQKDVVRFKVASQWTNVGKNDKSGTKVIDDLLKNKFIASSSTGIDLLSSGSLYELKFAEDTTWKQRLKFLDDAIESLQKSSDFDTSQDGLYNQLLEARDDINKVVSKEIEAATNYAQTLTELQVKQNLGNVKSYQEFEKARQEVIDNISNSGSIKNAISDGILSNEDIEKSVDNYISTFDKFSDYQEELVRRNTKTYENMSDAEKAWASQQKQQVQYNIVKIYQDAYDGAKEELSKEPALTLFEAETYKDKAKEISQIYSDLENAVKSIDDGGVPEPELFTKFPQLAEYADDADKLRQAIFKLMGDVPNDLIEELTILKNKIDLSTESIKNALDELSLGGKVDLSKRPVIDAKLLRDAGWDEATGDIATVYSSTYTNGETGKKAIAINFTPIVVDEKGDYVGVLTPDELDEYAESVIAGTRTDDLHLQIGAEFTGKNAEKEANATAEYIHQLQEYLYSYSSDELTKEEDKQKKQIEGFITLLGKLTNKVKNLKGELTNITASDYIKYEENSIQNIIDNLEREKDAQNDILDNLKSQKEELESIISDYEKTADVVGKYIDKTHIEPLEDRKSEIEDYYNAEIEKLKEENEERNRNIELQEKQDALANARKTRVRVFSETQGWHYENDTTAVKQAEKDLAEYQNSMAIENLEKARDAEVKGIEEQIKSWEEYKEAWEKQVEAITEADEELIASKILGSEWQEKISEQNIDVMNNYGAEYASYNNKLKNHVNVEIANIERTIREKDKQIKDWKDYKEQISRLNKDIADSNSKYLDNLNQFVLDENSTWEQRIAHMKRNAEIIAELNKKASESNPNVNDVVYEITRNGEVLKTFDTEAEANAAIEELVKQLIPKQFQLPGMSSKVAEAMRKKILESLKVERVEKYATGGISSNTGFAWLDGTNNNTEVVFNAKQAKKLFDLVNSGEFANSIKNNILKEFKNPFNQYLTNSVPNNINNTVSLSFPNANINAKDYDTFKSFMDTYTNDLLLKMQVGL